MRIKFGNNVINLDNLKNFNEEKSVFTQKTLTTFEAELNVEKQDVEIIEDMISNGLVSEIDENGAEIKKYIIRSPYNANYGGTSTLYLLEFKENEILDLQYLTIDSLDVSPYEYSEEYDNEAIIINCKFKLSKREYEEFKNIFNAKDIEYFDVIRHGIEDRVLKMRFGNVLWSEHEENVKISAVLVEYDYDKNDDKQTFNFISNLNDKVAYLINFKDELLDLLVKKNILTDLEKDNLNNNIKDNINEGILKMSEVVDVDAYN